MTYLDALGNPVSPSDHVVLLRPASRELVRRVGEVGLCDDGMLLVVVTGKGGWSTWIKPADVQLTSSPVYGTSD